MDQVFDALVRWQAEAAVLGALLAVIVVLAVVSAALCRLLAWIWRTFGPREESR